MRIFLFNYAWNYLGLTLTRTGPIGKVEKEMTSQEDRIFWTFPSHACFPTLLKMKEQFYRVLQNWQNAPTELYFIFCSKIPIYPIPSGHSDHILLWSTSWRFLFQQTTSHNKIKEHRVGSTISCADHRNGTLIICLHILHPQEGEYEYHYSVFSKGNKMFQANSPRQVIVTSGILSVFLIFASSIQ
jgi:hypothetical protein